MATVNCICEHCKSKCKFYLETITPCLEVVRHNLYDDSEPFIACLIQNLNEFKCEYLEKGN